LGTTSGGHLVGSCRSDSRSGRNGGALPWALLVAGSVASLAANVALAEPTLVDRVIAAWPSFALTASYELLTRQVRRSAADLSTRDRRARQPQRPRPARAGRTPAGGLTLVSQLQRHRSGQRASRDLARQAWHWALAHRDEHGALPSGRAIARAHGRKERWGRLVKRAGLAGAFDADGARDLRPVSGDGMSGAGSAL